MDNGVGIAWVIMEDAPVLDCWRCREEKGQIWGLDRGDWSERMVCADENYAKAYSGLWEVFGRVLCVEGDEVVHGSGLSSHVGNKLMKLFECRYILKNDNGGTEQENEFKYGVQTAAWIAPASLMP